MSAPRWTAALLRRVAPPDRVDEVLGDLEEAHTARVAQRGPFRATVRTSFEALDMAFALWRRRGAAREASRGGFISLLDVKLGFRMLARYPGLTLVAGFALSFAVWSGAGTFEVLSQMVYPTLPFRDGERVVAIRLWDDSTNRFEPRILHDFDTWQKELRSIEHLGAFQTIDRNLITGEGRGEPVDIAEISPSAFTITQVQPILGRVLMPDDERAGASDVVLIGERIWEERFSGDPGIIGKTVRLGSSVYTVVGVMPADFGFPRRHAVWTPLRLNPLDYARRQGPGIEVFGRLAPRTTMEQAAAELANLGRRAAADFPRTHAHLSPRVASYPKTLMGLTAVPIWVSHSALLFNLVPIALLVLISANVALLMFARAAARESEIAVRTALGASRGRIIGQLFAEAVVLGGIAAIVGIGAAQSGLKWAMSAAEAILPNPYWVRPSLAPSTVFYAVGLTLAGAIVAGVLPALKVTSGFGARLKQSTAGGGGLQFGGVWTAIIVIQVAATVVFPSIAFFVRGSAVASRDQDLGFPTREFLSARVEIDRNAVADSTVAAFVERFGRTVTELERRLLADPAVTGVTFAARLPGMYHPWHEIEVDEGAVPPVDSALGHRASRIAVDVNYFRSLDLPVVAGRGFHSGDLAPGARVAVVNESFVQRVLGGRSAVDRRVRSVRSENRRTYDETAPWFEIVGVVPDLGKTSGFGKVGVYYPVARGWTYPVYMAIHVRGDPLAYAPRVRITATASDPALQLHELQPLERVAEEELRFLFFWVRLTTAVSSIALLLSLSGIYAVTSFTVSRKTREIGVRVALGASRWRLVLSIFRRPLIQVSMGIVVGAFMVAVLIGSAGAPEGGLAAPRYYGMISVYGALMMLVCMLACFVPMRRALRIEPTQALREE